MQGIPSGSTNRDETTASDTRHRGPARGARREPGGRAAPPRRSRPAHGFAPRQVVVKFDGERARAHAGAARRRRRARDGGGAAATTRASPTPSPTTSPPPRRPNRARASSSPTTPAPSTAPPKPPPRPATGPSSSGTSSPGKGDATSRLPISPGGIDAVGAWRNLDELGRPGAEGVTVAVLDTGIAYRDLGSRFVRSPDFAAGQFVKGYDFVDDDRLPLDENGHGTHVAGTIAEKTDNAVGADRPRLPGEADAGAGARQARPRPGERHRQGHPLRRRPPRPGDQHELQLRLRQEGAGGRRSAARGLRARRRHRRLGRQPRLGDLRLGAGDRAAGDRRRRHHRGRLPRQLLAGRQGDRPGRAGRRRAGRRLPLGLGAADLPGDAESGHDPQTFAIPSNYVGTSMAAAHVSGVAAMVLAADTYGGPRFIPETGQGANPASTASPSACAKPPAAWACRRRSRAPA